jgi:uncharacterized protein YbjT (DUF2867 family)
MTTTMILGASGNVGQVIARHLVQAGQTIRKATSREPAAPDQVHLDITTPATLDKALTNIDQAFLMSPPGLMPQDRFLNPVIDAAKRQGLKKIVLMTAMGVDFDDSIPLRQAELHLERSGLRYAVVRPNWFMQNFNSFWIEGIRSMGKIMLPTGRARGSFVDARDIGAVVAKLLLESTWDGSAYELTGPKALDHDEVAAILSKASGKTIGYINIPEDQMRAPLIAAGLTPAYAEALLQILAAFKAGAAERVTDAIQTITGRAPISLEQYAQDYRNAWMS